MRLWIRRVFLTVLALAVVAALVWAFLPKPVGVDLEAVARGALLVTVDEEGETRLKDRYEVSCPLAGRMTRVELKPGDPVVEGQTLLTEVAPTDPSLLDPRARAEAETRVREADTLRDQALSGVKAAELRHAQARTDLTRGRMASGGVSQQELETLQARERLTAEEVRSYQIGVRVAEARLELSQAALLRTRPRSPGEADPEKLVIRSPITGKVLRVLQESAAVVAPGQKIVELGDPTKIECWIRVLSADAVKVVPGARVSLEQWGGEKPLQGRVRLVQPSGFKRISALGVEEQRVWVVVDFVDPPEARPTLGDLFRVEARIVVWEDSDVLKVPSSALFRQGDGWAVFVAAGERAEVRPVRVGRNNGLEAQVLSGLDEGDQVIVHPSDKIKDGVKIAPR